MAAFEIIAGHAGSCCCGIYIKPGVSKIVALSVPLPPDPSVTRFCGERGVWYLANAVSHIRPRRWIHARCHADIAGLSFAELEMLAADRRQALAAMKKEAERTYGRQHGRQRRARSKAARGPA